MASTLRDHLIHLQNIAKENPECLDMPVVYSQDDEGNGYSQVHYTPQVGYFEGHSFTAKDGNNHIKVNSILIN